MQKRMLYFLEHGIHFVHVSYSGDATCNKIQQTD